MENFNPDYFNPDTAGYYSGSDRSHDPDFFDPRTSELYMPTTGGLGEAESASLEEQRRVREALAADDTRQQDRLEAVHAEKARRESRTELRENPNFRRDFVRPTPELSAEEQHKLNRQTIISHYNYRNQYTGPGEAFRRILDEEICELHCWPYLSDGEKQYYDTGVVTANELIDRIVKEDRILANHFPRVWVRKLMGRG